MNPEGEGNFHQSHRAWPVVASIAGISLLAFGAYSLSTRGFANQTALRESVAKTAGTSDASTMAAAAALASAPLTETYTDPDYHFSFNYPAELTLTAIPGDGEADWPLLLLLFDTPTDFAFQIAISPFTEPAYDLIADRIKEDIPGIVMNNTLYMNLGNDRDYGITFLDGDPSASNTYRQIWLAGNGYLYQISSDPDLDNLMWRIIETWQLSE